MMLGLGVKKNPVYWSERVQAESKRVTVSLGRGGVVSILSRCYYFVIISWTRRENTLPTVLADVAVEPGSTLTVESSRTERVRVTDPAVLTRFNLTADC